MVKDLAPLWNLEFEEPVAATVCNSMLRKELVCIDKRKFAIARKNYIPDGRGFISSFLIFNIPKWRDEGILEKCKAALLKRDVHFKTGDQALLNWVLYCNWHILPKETQAHVGRAESIGFRKDKVFIKHFLGTNPWDEIPKERQPFPYYKMAAREEWRKYYEMH